MPCFRTWEILEYKARAQGISKCQLCLLEVVSSLSMEVCKHRLHPDCVALGGGSSSCLGKGK